MRCGLRVETAGELRDMLRIPELGPELCSVLSFCQADPLGQPHTYPRLYLMWLCKLHPKTDTLASWWNLVFSWLSSHFLRAASQKGPLYRIPLPSPPAFSIFCPLTQHLPQLRWFYIPTDLGDYCPSCPLEQRQEIWLPLCTQGPQPRFACSQHSANVCWISDCLGLYIIAWAQEPV